METKVADKKKSEKAKKHVSARQQKKEAIQRNIHAAVQAIEKYNKKPVS